MFKEYDVIRLKRDLDVISLKAGTRGTIVMVYPGDTPEYEVEFVSGDGETIAVKTVAEKDIERE